MTEKMYLNKKFMFDFIIYRNFHKKGSGIIKNEIIFSGAVIENILYKILIKLSYKNEDIDNLSLYQKINELHKNNIINSETQNMLHIYRRIRNEFVHNLHKFYFYNIMNGNFGLGKELIEITNKYITDINYKEDCRFYEENLYKEYYKLKTLEKMMYKVDNDKNFYVRYNIMLTIIYLKLEKLGKQ